MKILISIGIVFLFSLTANSQEETSDELAPQEGGGRQVGLIAEFRVPTEKFDTFIEAARRELRAVRKNEPGCLRFDVLVFDESQGHGAFVEVFVDQKAAQKHRQLFHFKEFFREIENIDVQWTTRFGKALE